MKKKNLKKLADGKTFIFVDMDGVLADFFGVDGAVERFENEKDFFKNLAPIKPNVEAVRRMVDAGIKVFILTASPHDRADGDKREWLEKYLPEIKWENIITMRIGEKKSDYVLKKGRIILFDDYGKNCRDFQADGFEAYKIDKWHTISRYLNLI